MDGDDHDGGYGNDTHAASGVHAQRIIVEGEAGGFTTSLSEGPEHVEDPEAIVPRVTSLLLAADAS